MEIFARLKSASPVFYREWAKDNGEKINIKCVNVELIRGGDTFICEANDRVADRLEAHPIAPGEVVVGYVKFTTSTTKEGRTFQNARLVEILAL